MGTICILFGVIVLFAFTGVGFMLSNYVLSNPTYLVLFGIKTPAMAYFAIVGICLFIGLLIFMGLLINGLTYNRVKRLTGSRKHRKG